ncbi:hypothetical protein PVAND_002078 [Polypedilum vanderplanki]|uniref:Gustatory receptor n=1 Tax=Polypedilum vanderplanki TaxID=319348 RepID=A0A9J6BQF2_POLVA|nr:hypothetical protein PVAND_002078 [Polypedilum vanderplanki]
MVIVCQKSENENNETCRLISKLMNKNICSTSFQSFGNQAKGANVKSTCGLFNFDLSLIGMIISSMITYFIIFIQFEISLQSKS